MTYITMKLMYLDNYWNQLIELKRFDKFGSLYILCLVVFIRERNNLEKGCTEIEIQWIR